MVKIRLTFHRTVGVHCTVKLWDLLFSLDLAGASLVSVEDSAEASFLTYIIEPLEGKTSTFWTGMYRNVDGNFFNYDFFLMNNCHKLFDMGVKNFILYFSNNIIIIIINYNYINYTIIILMIIIIKYYI